MMHSEVHNEDLESAVQVILWITVLDGTQQEHEH